MKYRITIVELLPNPAYDPTRQQYTSAPEFTERQTLVFMADDQQFAAIRKAALEAM